MGNIGSLSHEKIGNTRSDSIADSPREKVQASAARLTRSKSAENLKRGGKCLASYGAKCDETLQSLPHPQYVFENQTSVYDTDHEEKGEDSESRKSKEGKDKKSTKSWPVVSALKFLAKPFKKYGSKKELVAVKARVPPSTNTAESHEIGSQKGSDGFDTCSLKDMNLCGAFELKINSNLSSSEAEKVIRESLVNPASLVGYQIYLTEGEESPVYNQTSNHVYQRSSLLSERIRVITAYAKEASEDGMQRKSLYLLTLSNGDSAWHELKRSPKKRGFRFTVLRKVVCE